MATFKRFEEIKAWQKAREIAQQVYRISKQREIARDYGLKDQIQRSCVSIMANIAEAYGWRSDKEFANFLNMAHGSAAETQSHLYIALDQSYISQETFSTIYAALDEVSRMTIALSQHLRRT